MRILITGGAGFIGSHLVEGFARESHDVVVLDNLSSGRSENLVGLDVPFELIVGDIRDRAVVKKALEGVEGILHHAAIASVPASVEEPFETGTVNIQGTALLLEEARHARVGRVVLASSSAVYGEGSPPLSESDATLPLSPYGAHKLAGEHLARAMSMTGEIDAGSLRYFNVYGPRQRSDSDYAAAIPIFFDRIARGESPRIFGDGTQTRDFVHVSDVLEANRQALLCPTPLAGRAFNVAGGSAISIEELATEILAISGANLPVEFAAPRAGDIVHSHAAIARIEGALGWKPRTTLKDGLETLVEERAQG